jgi:mono/diheme cytochrome c family protein
MIRTSLFLMLLVAAPIRAIADEPAVETEPAAIDVKKVFAKNCALCHFNYGMDVGRGAPKLAGTQLSAKEVHDRIANGKTGAMPAFKKLLTDAEIQALTDYVKGLPAK